MSLRRVDRNPNAVRPGPGGIYWKKKGKTDLGQPIIWILAYKYRVLTTSRHVSPKMLIRYGPEAPPGAITISDEKVRGWGVNVRTIRRDLV